MTGLLTDFPYPFKEDVYRYSNNSIPLETSNSIEITQGYKADIQLKRRLLTHSRERCYQSLPHTLAGQWEIVELVIEHLTVHYPEYFTVNKNGSSWTFANRILGEEQSFIFGDESTLPCEPLEFIGKHVQEDVIYMKQRDGDLFLDAGQLCFPANWSLAFDLGMSFKEIHSPIPGFKEEGLDDRILRFLLKLESGSPWWRKNWSLMAGNRMDTSLETFDVWGQERKKVTKENAGKLVHLRVEVQKLFRLPRTMGILFTIHTHLLPLEELCSKPEWLFQFYEILRGLPPHITEYKGLSLFKDQVIEYLQDRIGERNWQ
ncbi:heme-dependent oxidative N-demethylase family protein [Peribacillus sp. SCS-155]|uniref:heme-dependent oxidative N-demethylase family protein n=1 Tax=Peribacillus sedimenti TaxID=3115297 RepID=UPI0039057F72